LGRHRSVQGRTCHQRCVGRGWVPHHQSRCVGAEALNEIGVTQQSTDGRTKNLESWSVVMYGAC
jgi:hypothetical protein